jgi:hypothetical protein
MQNAASYTTCLGIMKKDVCHGSHEFTYGWVVVDIHYKNIWKKKLSYVYNVLAVQT